MVVETLEDLTFLTDHDRWIESLLERAKTIFAQGEDEIPPVTFYLGYDDEYGYVQLCLPKVIIEDPFTADKVRKMLARVELSAAASVLNSTLDGKQTLLLVLETEKDIRVRAYEVNRWENGQLVIGELLPWMPQKEEAEIPTRIPRKNLN